jgi:hypothetical protein
MVTRSPQSDTRERDYAGVMPDDFWGNAIFSLVPTLLFGVLFWFVFRGIIRSDGAERDVAARIEAEERAKRAVARENAGS